MSDKLTYQEIVDKISDEMGETKKFGDDYIKELVAVINEGLERNGRVHLAGFGTFELRTIAERPGINPQTGEEITIPEHTRVAFHPASKLERHVNRRFRNLKPEPIHQKAPAGPTEPYRESSSNWKMIVGILAVILILIFVIWLFTRGGEEGALSPETPPTAREEIEETPASPSPAEQATPTPPEKEAVRIQPEQEDITYDVSFGNTLWGIAAEHYRNAYYWPNIYRVNLEKIDNPNIIVTGIQLFVPGLKGTTSNLTEQDSLNMATGYFEAYKAFNQRGDVKAYYYLWVSKKFNPAIISTRRNEIDDKDLEFVNKMG